MSLRSEIIEVGFPRGMDAQRALTAWIDEQAHTSKRSILRWGLVGRRGDTGLLELAWADAADVPPVHWHHRPAAPRPARAVRGLRVALVVPTGVGAAIGGYIGDASPVARVLETLADEVLLHANVVNAAALYGAGPKSLYVDGLTLDRFFRGELLLSRPRHTRIGVVLDHLDAEETDLAYAAIDAARSVHGVDIVAVAICPEKLRSTVLRSEQGHYLGSVDNPRVLLDTVDGVRRQGATSIALLTEFAGIEAQDLVAHYQGQAPNPYGALEAMLSRAVTAATGLPCAHGPVLPRSRPAEWIREADARVAGELVSRSGLGCVLQGLARGIEGIAREDAAGLADTIAVEDLTAILVPFDCAGGPPAIYGAAQDLAVIGVRDNHCRVGVSAADLELRSLQVAGTYAEAFGLIACERARVPASALRRPLPKFREPGR